MRTLTLFRLDPEKEKDFVAALYEEYKNLMFYKAKEFTKGDVFEAEEIVQESMEKLMKKVKTLRGLNRNALTAYVVSTIRNTAINRVRRKNLEEKYSEIDSWELETFSPSAEEIYFSRQEPVCLADIWALLTPVERSLLEDRYILEYSNRELAEQYGCTTDAMRVRLSRLRQKVFNMAQQAKKEQEQYENPKI